MTDTLIIPAHGLRKYERDGEVTVLMPMEPQPDGVYWNDDCGCAIWEFGGFHCNEGTMKDTYAPFKPGDVVCYCRVVKPYSQPVEYIEDKATVLSCSAVKVAEMTESDWRDCGRVNPDTDNWPDGNMYAWAVQVQRERKDDGTNGDL